VAKEWTHCLSEQQANNNMNGSAKNNGDSNNVKQQQKQQSKKRRLDGDTNNGNGNNQLLLRNKENANNTNAEYDKESQIIQTALERAFLLTDIQSRMDGITTSGATVVCCVVIPKFDTDGKLSAITIHAANAGKSAFVLFYQMDSCVKQSLGSFGYFIGLSLPFLDCLCIPQELTEVLPSLFIFINC